MADNATTDIEIDNEDDDLEDLYDDDADYEDYGPALTKVMESLKEDEYLVKVFAGWQRLSELREWLADNCVGPVREVNWATGGCSSAMGVVLTDDMDIVLTKLRWS